MLVLEAADDFSYGAMLGRRYGGAYRMLAGLTRPLPRSALRGRLRALEEHGPRALERLEGLSRASGVDTGILACMGPGNPFPVAGCTNFAAVPPATRDGRIFLSWNLDLPPYWRRFMGRFPFYVRKIKGRRPYLCIDHSFMGLPLAYGFGVMNSDGLSCVYNAVGMTDGGDGLTFFELNNIMMEDCSDATGAAGVMAAHPRFVLPGQAAAIMVNANLLVADRGGEAALIEYSHRHVQVAYASHHHGILASANHHQFIDRGLTGGADPLSEPLIAGSYARLARMWELLRARHGSIDAAAVQDITSDHGCNYETLREFGMEKKWFEERVVDSTICAHPWNARDCLKRLDLEGAVVERFISSTLYGILLEPARCTMWFHPGNPCRNRFKPYWLGDMLEMQGADKARGELEYEPGPGQACGRRKGRGRVFTRPLADSPFSRAARAALMGFTGRLDEALSQRRGKW